MISDLIACLSTISPVSPGPKSRPGQGAAWGTRDICSVPEGRPHVVLGLRLLRPCRLSNETGICNWLGQE